MDGRFDSRIVTRSQVHAQSNPYEEDFETGIDESPRDEHSMEQNPPHHRLTETLYVSWTKLVASEAIAQAATSSNDPRLLHILELIQVQNMAFQQAQQQTNETLANTIGRPITVAQQTKPPTLPQISNGPEGQQDISCFEAHIQEPRHKQKFDKTLLIKLIRLKMGLNQTPFRICWDLTMISKG